MNQREAIQYLAYLQAMFPHSKQPDAEIIPLVAQTWADIFSEVSLEVMTLAAQRYLDSNDPDKAQFIPSVSAIRYELAKISAPDSFAVSAEVAFSDALKAVRKWGSYREDKALEELEPLTREAVKTFGYQELCQSEVNDSGTRAHFYRTFDAIRASQIARAKKVDPELDKLLSPDKPLAKPIEPPEDE